MGGTRTCSGGAWQGTRRGRVVIRRRDVGRHLPAVRHRQPHCAHHPPRRLTAPGGLNGSDGFGIFDAATAPSRGIRRHDSTLHQNAIMHSSASASAQQEDRSSHQLPGSKELRHAMRECLGTGGGAMLQEQKRNVAEQTPTSRDERRPMGSPLGRRAGT